ncbi:MAG: hypothetical protein Q4A75_07965, partial [Peptostreptococcaceae bacterium]|nr:hypothetical protein [Peptostreptococcaceae bacterium]
MEKIKDFIYEKSDLFFASIIVVLVGVVILYNLDGWFVIDSESSKYHQLHTQTINDPSGSSTTSGEMDPEKNPLFATAERPKEGENKPQEQNK